ncbi:TetR/AcrR family transcriptional regulator [Streptomyces hiroshimensis]|uniref:HTH-type transcriptional regulator YdeS n=1 Tax=Streptomyces hiroshimensis TaxID=66424 RepID=A0ABQ2Z9M6_9ACTN|nr:TetR/AcrR family transcriptional regulator [Streptomyces hiroshimensis]GGY05550.1 putative HTH-type transcriptional regulator YdeS [Streptomyces hiroshimensis]
MATAARRGRPRAEGTDDRILGAACDLLLARGYDGYSIDEVAQRAGVAKTTLYRRWPTKDHLIVAVVARIQDEVPVRDTGDIRRDLTAYLEAVAAGLTRMSRVGRPAGPDDRSAGLVAEIVAAAARRPDVGRAVRAVFARRNALPLALLESAQARGDLGPGARPDVIFDQLAGALYYRLLVTGEPVGGDYPARLVDQVLAGARAPGPEGKPS